jgi:hypothetical protein
MPLYDTPGLTYDSGVFYDVVAPPPLERKRMAKVKVGLKNLSRDEIADKLNTVKTAMTGNANFTTPNPPLATLTSQETTLAADWNFFHKMIKLAAARYHTGSKGDKGN